MKLEEGQRKKEEICVFRDLADSAVLRTSTNDVDYKISRVTDWKIEEAEVYDLKKEM